MVAVVTGLRYLQQSDGSFTATLHGTESDVRFVYCVCAIAELLDLWSAVDKERTAEYILQCQTYEGGFGLRPGCETQGGATYCAVAALTLMQRLPDVLDIQQQSTLLQWCLRREQEGYEGRTGKDPDTCYCFWVGATIAMLRGDIRETDLQRTRRFILDECQNARYGGFAKFPDGFPDILHSYYSLCWLSMAEDLPIALHVPLGISQRKWQQYRQARGSSNSNSSSSTLIAESSG